MKIRAIFLILLCFLLSGCHNYRELNDSAIISAIGISYEKDNIKLTIQVLDTNKESDSEENQAKYVLFNTTGKTVEEALRNVMNESSKRLLLSHMQILLISDEVALEGINDIIDFFFREAETRKQYVVLITKDDIEDILSTETLLEKINSKNIKERMDKNAIFLNNINNNSFSQLLSDYLNPHKELLISTLEIIDNEKENNSENNNTPTNRILLGNSAIFNSDKLVGYIDSTDVIYYNFVENNIDNTLLTFKYNNQYISIEVISNNTKIDVKNNNITITLKIKANINDISSNINLADKENIKDLEATCEAYLQNGIQNSIQNIIDEYDTDIYGFTDLIYKNANNYYKNNDISLQDINVKIKANVTISYKGNGDDNIDQKN